MKRIYHDNGSLSVEFTTVGRNIDGLYTRWYRNGQKMEEYTYINGQVHGLYQEWHENGQKAVKYTYIDGKLEGLYQRWHSNGKKDCERNLTHGVVDGFALKWDNNGELSKIEFYRILKKTKPYISNIEIDLKDYVRDLTAKYKEELVAAVWNPDRMDRIANLYNIETYDYMEMLESTVRPN